MTVRKKIRVTGIVQGVGFRPFIHNLAESLSLNGFVRNDTTGVSIEVEGEEEKVIEFLSKIEGNAPPFSRIEKIGESDLPPAGHTEFTIDLSRESEEKFTLVSPDIATCEDCLAELFNTEDRRFRYPFTNCTNCGPRFTIIERIPYDRANTTMNEFRMCADCQEEYQDPRDRRFHAQPDACPVCGPRVHLIDNLRREPGSGDPIAETSSLLREGCIVAIKGLGGFHLACDAENPEAVSTLRRRKKRTHKPFALMAPTLGRIEEICELSPAQEKLLLSPRRPIVLLKKKSPSSIAEEVAPRQRHLGIMLPYTPLHHLILTDSNLVLVMTSGNRSDEPIVCQDEEAFDRLKGIADYFLMHNRRIHARCDDSVAAVSESGEMLLRRARGYAPEPVKLPFALKTEILATGGELKSTFCLTKDDYAFLSHHIGDLKNLQTLTSFEKAIEHFQKLFHIKPRAIAYDLHPEYLSTKYALRLASPRPELGAKASARHRGSQVELAGVQHHFAHIASCLAENGVNDEVIGVAFDGTGYGLDGNMWGGEFIVGSLNHFERVGHFRYVPMPGGESAVREPWRMAFSYLYYAFGDEALDLAPLQRFDRQRLNVLKSMVDSRLNSPLTSSAGRLFDGVSSILGLRDKVDYEGQAAIELEQIASPDLSSRYDFEIVQGNGVVLIEPSKVLREMVRDMAAKVSQAEISARFHSGLSELVLKVASILRQKYGTSSVALSGGVFQNMVLLDRTHSLLVANGFTVYTHHLVPPNDGGLSLGQAVLASATLA